MKTRTVLATLVGATLALTTAIVGLPNEGASAVTLGPVGNPAPIGGGTLVWKSSGNSSTITYSAAVPGTTPQTLSGQTCKFSTSGSQYLSFAVTGPNVSSSTPAAPGYKDLSLGVRSGNESNGTQCKQVNRATTPVETLTVAVNRAATGPLAGSFGVPSVRSALLDLNLSGNAIVRAAMYKVGVGLVGTAEMQTGFSAPQTPGDPAGQLFTCNFASNSGPQSGFNNNCYWAISPLQSSAYTSTAPGLEGYVGPGGYVGPTLTDPPSAAATDWDYLVLTPVIGDFSIQGGNSYPSSLPGSAGTVFNIESLSDGQIDCFDPSVPSSLAAAQASANGDPRAVITRLLLGDQTKTCAKKPYSYSDSGNTSTYHQQSTADQSTSQYTIVLPRDFTAAQVTAAATSATSWPPLPKTIANWEDGSPDVTLKYCIPGLITSPGTEPYYVPTVDYSKITSSTTSLDQSANSPFIQYACIYRQSNVENLDGSVTAFDYIYFLGDIRLSSG